MLHPVVRPLSRRPEWEKHLLAPRIQTDVNPYADNIWKLQRCRVMPASNPGRLPDLLHLLGVADDAPAMSAVETTVPVWHVRAAATLFHEGSHAEHLHVVRSGSFKTFRTAEDGYEQVLGFVGQGGVLGFEALSSDHEPVAAVALEDATVFVLPLRELNAWRQRFPALDQGLQIALSAQLARAGETAEMLAAVAAEVRLARFLVWQSARMAERGQSARRLRLRMTRREIASLLGVAHETVSRSFGALAGWGLLKVDNREVEITDPDGLKRCARNTRLLVAESAHRGSPSLPEGVKLAAA